MNGGLRFSLIGAVVLVTLSGCGRGFFQAERAPWRHDAEVACLKSGVVKLGAGVVQADPIEGPGACGADFPLRVSALGESATLGYADELRPKAMIPITGKTRMPRWPVRTARPRERLRWVVGPPAINAPRVAPPRGHAPPGYASQAAAPVGEPMSLAAPDATPGLPTQALPRTVYPPPKPTPVQRARAMPDDIPPDAIIPPGGSAAVPERSARPTYPPVPRRHAYNAPVDAPVHQPPRLGPARNYTPVAMPAARLSPPATLSCPIVSALDRWVSAGVQPAALHWFGSPVVAIKQIGSYACRRMIGAKGHHISEHAFGDALDIAGFTFADGRTVTVKNGWHGSPEEQGFLHDVQLYACETFNTVLAPGYNPEHYNHIHVDLMRRHSGRRPCRPTAIKGEIVAARARAHYASKRHRLYTGSISTQKDEAKKTPTARPGADGYVADADDNDAGDKNDDVTGSIPSSLLPAVPKLPAKPSVPKAIPARDRFLQIY